MNLWWKACIVVALVAALVGVARNGASIDQVCSTVQAQQNRNYATVYRGLQGLRAIRAGDGKTVPGWDYYHRPEHRDELLQAIRRSERELRTYKRNVC